MPSKEFQSCGKRGGGENLSEDKEIHRQIAGCNVTITFKGYNPDIKDTILNLFCDGFEERVMNSEKEEEEKPEPQETA